MYSRFDATILKAGDQVGIRRPGSWQNHYQIATVKRVTKTFVEIAAPRFNDADHVRKFSTKTNEEMHSIHGKYRRPELVSVEDAQAGLDRLAAERARNQLVADVERIAFSSLTDEQLKAIKDIANPVTVPTRD